MVVAYCNGGFLCAILQKTYQSDQRREDVQKGMFDAFHILKKIADNLKKPMENYGNLLFSNNQGLMHANILNHMYMSVYVYCIYPKIQQVHQP